MKNISADLRARIRLGVTTLCTCISIRRRDGAAYFLTDHDEPVNIGGAVHQPLNSFSRTSVASSSDLEVDSMELHGILNSEAVARIDVASGLFDFAEVSVFMVDYENPLFGQADLRTGWMGEVTMSEDGTFTAEVRGLTQVLTYRIGEGYAPECRANLGDKRCKLPLLPARWQMTTPYKAGFAVLGKINAATNFENLSFANASFDADAGQAPKADPTGWTSLSDTYGEWAFTSTANGVAGPKSGSVFVYHTNRAGQQSSFRTMSQTLSLVAQGVDMNGIASGLCRLTAGLWAVCLSNVGTASLEVFARDAAGVETGLFSSGVRKNAEDVWFRLEVENILIPAGTTHLTFRVGASKKKEHTFGVGFDLISGVINYPNGTFGSADQYGDVCFVAQNSGISGAIEPAFSNALGSLTQDDTVSWKAVKSWSLVKTVRAPASDNRSFVPEALVAPVGYYDGGLITWETGKNAGRSQEIKTWKAGRLTLFQRPYYSMQPGDRYALRPGCDKRRVTCNETFDNVLNFRGEPDVPGQDEYYKTPNAQSEE